MMMLNFDFVLRLLVAGILGAIIGLDREYRAKEAGYRTHFLVSLGSALIMIVSQYGFQEIIKESSVTLDPSRVAAQVVSGIGFIGAGTIIFQKQIVRGLTTAAGIWATAGIGLAVGAGMYAISIAATLLTLAGLELLSLIFKSIGMKSSVITFSTSSKEILPQVSRRFNSKDYLVVSYNLDRQVQGEYTNYQVTMVIKSKKGYDEGYLLQLMQEFPEVTVEKIEEWESLLFFREIFPIAHGHVLLVLPGIEAFLDADCLEIGFPERLEKPFVFVHQTFVEHAGDKMSFATVLTKSHLAHLFQVVIVPIGLSIIHI